MNIYVQFADATAATIVASFSDPQDAQAFPNQGTVDSSDARWKTYYATLPEGSRGSWPAPPAST